MEQHYFPLSHHLTHELVNREMLKILQEVIQFQDLEQLELHLSWVLIKNHLET